MSDAVKKVTENTENNSRIEFIGKAWKNIVKNENSPAAGKEYINVTLDRDIEEVKINKNVALQLWPNKKREGKQDADYRVSIVPRNR